MPESSDCVFFLDLNNTKLNETLQVQGEGWLSRCSLIVIDHQSVIIYHLGRGVGGLWLCHSRVYLTPPPV